MPPIGACSSSGIWPRRGSASCSAPRAGDNVAKARTTSAWVHATSSALSSVSARLPPWRRRPRSGASSADGTCTVNTASVFLSRVSWVPSPDRPNPLARTPPDKSATRTRLPFSARFNASEATMPALALRLSTPTITRSGLGEERRRTIASRRWVTSRSAGLLIHDWLTYRGKIRQIQRGTPLTLSRTGAPSARAMSRRVHSRSEINARTTT